MTKMSLPPVFYHYFRRPLPYVQALVLQEKIHAIQNSLRRTPKFKDILLLLEHRPVYTAGRRQTEDTVQDDRIRLTRMGADFVTTTRGGQLTYHGPGQLVGYPFLDLSSFSPTMGAKDYVCRMQKMLERHLNETHGIESSPSEHTGIFLDPTTKIASIGVQVRHRLTSHGFAMNITREPLSWFEKIVACGLDDVRAGCVESAIGKAISVSDEIPGIVKMFGQSYQRDMEALIPGEDGQIYEAIREMENAAEQAKHWSREPLEQVQ